MAATSTRPRRTRRGWPRSAGCISCRRSIPSWCKGVATYALELFRAVPDLDTVYAPIGMGSGICGLIAVRDLLGLEDRDRRRRRRARPRRWRCPSRPGHPVPTNSAHTFADGMACREPDPRALDIIRKGAARVVRVDEDEIAEAIRIYWTATHNVAEGAGAAPLAALLKERERMQGKRVGLILSGGNIDAEALRTVLDGRTPAA